MNLSILAAEGGYQEFTLGGGEKLVLLLSGLSALLAIGVGFFLQKQVLAMDTGSPKMQSIAKAIHDGAIAYLKRQFRTIGLIVIPLALVVFLTSSAIKRPDGTEALNFATAGIARTIAFLLGCLASGLTGYIGMSLATRGNVRTAAAALSKDRPMPKALDAAFKTGGVAGMFTVGLGLLGATLIIWVFQNSSSVILVGFGFGGSLLALFLRVGGGIFTKAADVGADLVGKVEAGIPEDDPRNAAVIADLVGDNVGDCAGRGADLFESMSAENIGAMILGVAIFTATGRVEWILFPLVLRSFGVFATIIGMLTVPFWAKRIKDPMGALNGGYWVITALSVGGLAICTYAMLDSGSWFWFFLCGVVGILTGIAFVYITQYYTAGAWRPVQEIARASKTGAATNMIIGTAVGFETTAVTATNW